MTAFSALQSRCNLLVAALASVDLLICVYYLHTHIFHWLHPTAVGERNCLYMIFYGLLLQAWQRSVNLVLGVDRILVITATQRWANFLCFKSSKLIISAIKHGILELI
jgi:hypothetical protein